MKSIIVLSSLLFTTSLIAETPTDGKDAVVGIAVDLPEKLDETIEGFAGIPEAPVEAAAKEHFKVCRVKGIRLVEGKTFAVNACRNEHGITAVELDTQGNLAFFMLASKRGMLLVNVEVAHGTTLVNGMLIVEEKVDPNMAVGHAVGHAVQDLLGRAGSDQKPQMAEPHHKPLFKQPAGKGRGYEDKGPQKRPAMDQQDGLQ